MTEQTTITGYDYQVEWAWKMRTGMWPADYAEQLTEATGGPGSVPPSYALLPTTATRTDKVVASALAKGDTVTVDTGDAIYDHATVMTDPSTFVANGVEHVLIWLRSATGSKRVVLTATALVTLHERN